MREPDAPDIGHPAIETVGTAAGGGDLMGTASDPPEEPAATQRSIWPAIYPELLELIQEHRSTIVFVNSRRGAERLAVRLNELAGEDGEPAAIARAHHGSLAREERLVVEDLLKSGELPCLVATSSLELGIDMGAVDLVIQVESPKSVTAGLQRIGRAGHGVGEVSRGPDLPQVPRRPPRVRGGGQADARRRDRDRPWCRATRSTCSPSRWWRWWPPATTGACRSCTSWCATPTPSPSSRASCSTACSTCSTAATRARSSPSCGRGSSGTAWRTRSAPARGALQLAVTNAGTIPDRGLYGVHLPDGRRVGELDEEMVYEARPGQTFLLGASTWRIEEITRDRVIVTPAPGAPGRHAVLEGRGHRPPEGAGRARSARSRARRWTATRRSWRPSTTSTSAPPATSRPTCASSATPRASCPPTAPIVVERFRDEIGDWRLCVLSPFGGRVHAAWALALSARIRDDFGLESDAIWSDDGIIVHLPDADEPPSCRPRDGGAGRARGAGGARAVRLGAVRRALPRERRARAAAPARLPGQAHAAVAAAAEGAVAARGGQALRPVPDRARDLPRVPARRARPARAWRSCCAGSTRASCRWSRPRPSAPRRSPPRCCSTTWPPTCTRATRPTPSGARRRSPSTATCCASCSARRSCAS